MSNELANDRLSIKNLLFTKAKPSYIPHVPYEGYKLHACIDCGDRYVFQSSYEQHVNRKSMKITYFCRHCNNPAVFFNRCNLLSHIRSHAFKTFTINVSDLKIEPLPLSEYKITVPWVPSNLPQEKSQPEPSKQVQSLPELSKQVQSQPEPSKQVKPTSQFHVCPDCKERFANTGVIYKDRASHYMRYTNEMHTCPICLFVLPTQCALKAHLRIHTKTSPCFCPECGANISIKSLRYPYNHHCEGFKMMRATTRLSCHIKGCKNFHPSQIIRHMKVHLKKVYKCERCVEACFNQATMERHIKQHEGTEKTYLTLYQCHLCPGRLVLNGQQENHLMTHLNGYVYPCWSCGANFQTPVQLLSHHENKLCKKSSNVTTVSAKKDGQDKSATYRVVKRCDQCKRGFTYKCKFNEIDGLPVECPFGCISVDQPNVSTPVAQTSSENNGNIVCFICKENVRSDGKTIKEHFAKSHQKHFHDVKIVLEKLDVTSYLKQKKNNSGIVKRKRRVKIVEEKEKDERKIDNSGKEQSENASEKHGEHQCMKCNERFGEKSNLESHLVTHRDPCTAYQCLECGECYVVKPSFSTHLLVEHGISDVEEYVKQKNCYNEEALARYRSVPLTKEPLKENQCSICRELFENHDDLEKHFRVHGMAFLMKNNSKKSP